jgi:hypothetical protein
MIATRKTQVTIETFEDPLSEGVVAKGGIEPPTHGFSVRCSTN